MERVIAFNASLKYAGVMKVTISCVTMNRRHGSFMLQLIGYVHDVSKIFILGNYMPYIITIITCIEIELSVLIYDQLLEFEMATVKKIRNLYTALMIKQG